MNYDADGIFAHSIPGRPWEPLERHLIQVSERCSEFAGLFGAQQLGAAAGLLHDAGKLRAAFQAYIRGRNSGAGHSVCGAVIAIERYGPVLGKLIAYVIAGHHGGMPDGGNAPRSLGERLAEAVSEHLLDDMAPWPDSLVLQNIPRTTTRSSSRKDLAYELHFLVRMLFSALVDADYLETERFYTPRQSEVRKDGSAIALSDLAGRLDKHLGSNNHLSGSAA